MILTGDDDFLADCPAADVGVVFQTDPGLSPGDVVAVIDTIAERLEYQQLVETSPVYLSSRWL